MTPALWLLLSLTFLAIVFCIWSYRRMCAAWDREDLDKLNAEYAEILDRELM